MNKEPRLRFTEEERADPALEKPIHKADKAAARADKAQAKIPKKQVRQKTVDPETGKVTTKLVLEDKKKPPSKLSHAVRDTPANAALGKLHKEIHESEQDNVGVESAHKSEETVETGVRLAREGYHSHKLKPYRKAAEAEQKLEKANVNALYQKSLQENPQLSSNPVSRWQQKQAIKKEYAAAKRAGQTAGNTASTAKKAGKAAKTVKEKAQEAGAFVMRHKKGFLIAGAIFLLVCMLLNTMSSCSMMAQSIGSVVSGTTYPSDDPELVAVEADYAAKEAELQAEIDNIESSHPGYDEYRYDLDMIGHDPHELAAYLSAVLQGYTRQSAQAELERVFSAQYKLTLTEEVEVRYRTETRTDSEGNSYTVEVPYNYYILNVKLTSKPISSVASELLTPEQLEMYQVYRQTLGNKPLIFGGGSADTSDSESLAGVEFVNGTRPGNQAVVDIAKSPGGQRGRPALLELVRLQQPRGVVRLFRVLVLRPDGAVRAALCRLPVPGHPVVPVSRTVGRAGLRQYRPRRRHLLRLGPGRQRRPCGHRCRHRRQPCLHRRRQFRRRLQDQELFPDLRVHQGLRPDELVTEIFKEE